MMKTPARKVKITMETCRTLSDTEIFSVNLYDLSAFVVK